MKEAMASPSAESRGHEPDRVSFPLILLCAGVIIVSTVLSHVAVWACMNGPAERNPNPTASDADTFQASRNWGRAAKQELASLRLREQNNLEGYAWLNEERTRARIPIRKAMEIVAARAQSRSPAGEAAPKTGGAP